jgi:hypothetical protein
MADLFFRGPYAAAVPRVGHKEPWIPADLEEAVRFTSGRTGTSGEIAFQRSVNSVDVIRLLAGNQGTSFEVSLGTAVHDMLSKSPRVVITTRTVAPLNLPSSFQVFRLLPFDDDQLSEFFEKSCSDTQQGAEDILQFLDKHLHVKDICRTPMVATIVSALHQNGYDLPRSRTEIYEKRFDLLMERWDRARGVANRCSVSATDKLRFLIRVAVKLHQEHRRRFSRAEGKAVWSQGFSRLYPNLDFDTVLAEMQFVNYIIYGEGGDEYSLGHLSYQEFLAAKGFLLGQRGRSLAKYVNDRWWHNVFVFYAGISGDIGPLLESIARQRDLDEIGSLLDEMIEEARYTSSLVRSVLSGFREERFGDDEDDEDDFAR